MESLHMNMRKNTLSLRYVVSLCLMLLLPPVLFAREATVPADAPFFTDRTLNFRSGIVAAAPFEAECVSEPGTTGRIAWDRILHRVEIEECRLPGLEGTYCFSPQVTVDDRGNVRIRKRPDPSFLPVGVLALLLFASGVFLLKKTEPGSAKRCCLLAVMTVLLHCGLLALFLCRTGYPVPIFNDDFHYLAAARTISSGTWAENMFRYTIGYPLLCIPYLFLIPHDPTSYAYLPAMSFVNGFVVSSLFAVCAFLLLRRLSGRDLLSFAGVAVWQFFLSFLVVRPYGMNGDVRIESAFALPSPEIFTDVFPILISSGHNGMSDSVSALVAMLCLLTAAYLKRPLLPLSLLFGFLCLIRINNIFFAPVLLLLLILKYRETLRKKGAFLFFCLTGALGFLAVFSVQFALNHIQFGNPFVFPYALHPNRASQGFLLSEFPGGFRYTCLWNNACLAWALPSLLLMKDRLLRMVLVLAVIPMMLFFCGYPEWRIMDMRGMISLWPFLFAAPFLSDWWKHVPRSVLVSALSAAAATTLFGSVPVRAAESLLPWHLEQLPYGRTAAFVLLGLELAFLLFALIRARPYRDLFLFLAMFALLFHAGTTLFAGILIAALCILVLRDMIRLRREAGELTIPFLDRN